LKTFIRKTKRISDTLWTLFPHLSKVFEKNKYVFGNLLDTFNQYLLNGKEYFAQHREFLVQIIKLANLSLFSKEPNITI